MADSGSQGGASFEQTPWTLLGRLARGGEDDPSVAEELARRYWRPVVSYLHALGVRHNEEAEEIAQDFFARVVVGRRLFERAARERGTLRALIKTALRRHLIDRAKSAGRGSGGCDPNLEIRSDDLSTQNGLFDRFDREWAAAQLFEAVRRAELHYAESGKPGHWAAFERFVYLPATRGAARPTASSLAVELGFESAPALTAAVQVVRTRVLVLLKVVVAETVADPRDLEAEYDLLMRILGGL
ncbi:MAG: hypothetical protein RIB32_01570 [Phycisphaerales bacterium]